jgi:ribosomal protein S18 acetylase RimI-like enzyme
MGQSDTILVRAFDGSLADAKGLLAAEKATFNESPYSPEQIQAMLSEGPQAAWLAIGAGEVVGFVVAFATASRSRRLWEVDLLAVQPQWQGHGLATKLIRAASAYGAKTASWARAVVATDNNASARAFRHAGFQPRAEICTLLVYRPKETGWRPQVASEVAVREATGVADDLRQIEAGLDIPLSSPRSEARGMPPPGSEPSSASPSFGATLLLAERDGRPAGYAEVIPVQTLLYRGAWIEALEAPDGETRRALVEYVLKWGVAAGWDEIGTLVPGRNWSLKHALLAQGYRSLGEFRWLSARLPLPDPAMPEQKGRKGEGQLRNGRV